MIVMKEIKLCLLILFLSLTNGFTSQVVRYDNYSLFKVTPRDAREVEFLKGLQDNLPYLDFWKEPIAPGYFVNIVTAPEYKTDLIQLLNAENIESEITIDNIQPEFDKQKVPSRYKSRSITSFDWTNYHTLEDIENWLHDLASAYPGVVSIIVGGATYEGRDIIGIKISYGSGRRGIFLEGGIHAREWISPSTVTYITNELLNSDDPETRAAAIGFDWYIFPVTNPDGYVYSHDFVRLWRKNRAPYGVQYGVDLNRNWNANWMVAGASNNPAAETYAGPGPFSEIETRSLSEYIHGIANNLDMYLSFHSYSELLLIPYGHTTDPLDNYYDIVKVGRRAMGSLSVRYGTQYTVGNIAEAIYMATGGSIDWVKLRYNVTVVALWELRDKGQYGFTLPPEQIIPNCEEVMDSILAMIRESKYINII